MKKFRNNYFKSNADSFSKRKFFGFVNNFFKMHIISFGTKYYHLPFMSTLSAGNRHKESWLKREVLYEYTNEEHSEYSKEKNEYNFNKNWLPMFIDRVDSNCSILDVGCNSGYNLSLFYDKGFHDLYGIDPQKSAVEFIKKNREYINIKEGYFGPLENDVRADCVIFIGSIDRIPYSSDLFAAINRCAKKYVFISTGEFVENFPRDWHFEMARIGFICIEKVTAEDDGNKTKRFDGTFSGDLKKIGSNYMFSRIS